MGATTLNKRTIFLKCDADCDIQAWYDARNVALLRDCMRHIPAYAFARVCHASPVLRMWMPKSCN